MSVTTEQAAEWIRSGYVVVVPLEHGYSFVVDAFNHDAVRTMHVLRGVSSGVRAQVLIAGMQTAPGIVREISSDVKILMENFWPGLLSIHLAPNSALAWDLGDGGALSEISIRVPSSQFVLELLKMTGPLATASISPVGQGPTRILDSALQSKSEMIRICDEGELPQGPLSSIVSVKGGRISMTRVGALSFEQLSAKVSGIAPSSDQKT